MAIFTAQKALNFDTMTQLASLVTAPEGNYSTNSTNFYTYDGDTISGTGIGFSQTGQHRPTAGLITSLDVDDGTLFPTNAFTITGLAHSFASLVAEINGGGAAGGLAFLLNGHDTINGSSGADLLRGFIGNDNIYGNGGADKLFGGADNDFIRGGAGKDIINGESGYDTVDYSDKTKAVVLTLKGATGSQVTVNGVVEDTIKNIERATGGSGADKFTGDGQANTFVGNGGSDTLLGKGGADLIKGEKGADTISGGSGNDYLFGGIGKDTLTGGTGTDYFYFDTALDGTYNVDTITDFTVGVDKIMLVDDIFTSIGGLSYFSGEFFAVGTAATELDDRIIYNKAAGKLFFDADGSGNTYGKILFAQVDKNTDLHFTDFALIG